MTPMQMKLTQYDLSNKRARVRKLQMEIEYLVTELQGVCDHSDTEDYRWESDNGYGRQSKQTGRRCVYCGWIDFWSRGLFTNPRNVDL